MSSVVMDIKCAITRNPIIATPQMTVEDAIAHMENHHKSCRVLPEELTPNNIDFVIQDLHDELRSRYLVVMEHQKILGVLTAQDILVYNYQCNNPTNLTIVQSITHPVAMLFESALTEFHTPLNLLR